MYKIKSQLIRNPRPILKVNSPLIKLRNYSNTAKLYQEPIKSYNVAVVGAGPAGFYVAHHLLNKTSSQEQFRLNIDIFDRLPTPYGLSRYGVAPDHPEVKNCEEYLDNLMTKYPDSGADTKNHSVRFFGNVNIGKDIPLEKLESHYHSIILSYGCTSADNQLNVPGNDLPGVISARQFVNWYNGHPDSTTTHFTPPDLSKIEDVTIVGNGNVALDVARVLLADPDNHWNPTDITTRSVDALRKSSVKNVNIVARRGLLESAFSNKEIRELLELSKKDKVKFISIDDSVFEEIEPYTKGLGRVDKRKVDILRRYSKQASEATDENDGYKTWSLQYLKSPVEFIKHPEDKRLLSATKLKINTLNHDSLTNKTTITTAEDAKVEHIKNELVILSIGYQGSPLEGFEGAEVSFDNRQNRILNHEGRILLSSSHGEESHNFNYKKGWYTAGWIKKGPKGVIATTMMESFETADQVIEDLTNGIHTSAEPQEVERLLDSTKFVNWQAWNRLSEKEIEDGKVAGKVREKVVDGEEMIKIALSS